MNWNNWRGRRELKLKISRKLNIEKKVHFLGFQKIFSNT